MSIISAEIKYAPCFTVIADETTDKSIESQFCIAVIYLKDGNLTERCIALVNPSSLSGEALARTILERLRELDLPLEKLIGQGYDGASAMSGRFKGCQAIIKDSCPCATYVHCSAHALNLTLMKACSVRVIKNVFDDISAIASFFRFSSKRNTQLKAAIDQMPGRITGKWRVHQPCETRWADRHSSVSTVAELYAPICEVLLNLSQTESECSEKASSLYTTMTSSQFCVGLCILEEVMVHTSILSQLLQRVDVDLRKAIDCVEKLKTLLSAYRSNSDKFHELYRKASDMIAPSEIKKPRIVQRQTTRANAPAESVEDYFRINVFNTFLDHLTTQLEDRFSEHAKSIMCLSLLLPCNISNVNFEVLQPSIDLYSHLLPAPVLEIKSQFMNWKNFCTDHDHKSVSDCKEALHLCDEDFYPAIRKLLQIFVTLPVSSATAERCFSAVRLLKSDLRTTMSESRLCGLSMIYIHDDININTQNVVDKFASKSRKLKL